MSHRERIIVVQQSQIEVYAGDTGYIVIKQSGYPDEDSVITVDAIHAKAIADAIMANIPNAVQFRAEWKAESDNESS